MKQKIIIYQVLPRLFGNDNSRCVPHGDKRTNGCGKLSDFTTQALNEIKELGCTHVWFTGVIEHATQTAYENIGIPADHPAVVKGKAGSPYAIKDYYDIAPDLADNPAHRMNEFENLVKRTHRAGLKVIIDFVPNHVARQYHSDVQLPEVAQLGQEDDETQVFAPHNNFYYIPHTAFQGNFDLQNGANVPYFEMPAKATGNDCFTASPGRNDWYETVKLNYGVDYGTGYKHFVPIPRTWQQMLHILHFWASKGIDGFRCDMAEMVPVEFWAWAIGRLKHNYPEILFIAEVYQPALYRSYLQEGGFDYLYDKVGLYDTLRAVACGYGSATAISGCWQSLNGLEQRMLNFLENHDEQRIASDFFAGNPEKGIPALIASACMNTNPFMIYFGQELGERGMDSEGFSGCDGRTTIFDYWSVDSVRCWRNKGKFDGRLLTPQQKELREFYHRVLTLCNREKAIREGLFFDLMYVNHNGWRFNEHRQYTFLRKADNELLFIAVNFDNDPVHVAINLPSHAFDYLQVAQQESCQAVDLLTGCTEELSLLPYRATEFSIPAHGGRIWKITWEKAPLSETEK